MTTTTTEAAATMGPCLIKNLREAKYNPRRHFDEKQLADLVESIKAMGIMNPLLVRPYGDEEGVFEIVGGARRFRAAKAAGLTEVPVIVRNLTDQQALEVAVIDNLQRADVHPLDEADGYEALMEQPGYDVAAIALKVGKSESYVYQRLKLTDLVEGARRCFFEGRITAAHAILIARLQPKDQKEALAASFSDDWDPEIKRRLPTLVSVRRLAAWIDNNVHLSLRTAPFATDDATLVPAAGTCLSCPKRTGNAPALFEDIAKKDTCTDRTCFQSKLLAFVNTTRAQLEGKGKKVQFVSDEYGEKRPDVLKRDDWQVATQNKGKCADTITGIKVGREEFGKIIQVCTNKNCRKHHERSSYQSNGTSKRTAAEEEKRQAELHAERVRLRARTLIFKDTVRSVKKLDREQLNAIAYDLVGNIWSDDFDAVYEDHEFDIKRIEKLDERELAQLIVAGHLNSQEDEDLIAEAKRLKVKVDGCQRLAEAQCDAERDLKERVKKWKNRVASQAKSFEESTCTSCGCTESDACTDPVTLEPCTWAKKPNEKTNAGTCSACAETDKK
jgi:ParB family chromosome partitioning protein